MTRDCRLCAIAKGSHNNEFDQPLFEMKSHFAVASIGGFIPGWSLLCTRAHVFSTAMSPEREDYFNALDLLCAAVAREYGRVVVFEHGATTEGSLTSCGTSHAHIHVVPFSGSLSALALKDESLTWEALRLEELSDRYSGSEYLFLADRYSGKQSEGWFAELRQPKSQYFRRLLANYSGSPDLSDYRTSPLADQAIATRRRLQRQFSTNATLAA